MLAALLLIVCQTPDQRTLNNRLQQKLRSEFLAKTPWLTDFEKARTESASSGRPILAYFTRSDAEAPACDKLERGLFLGDEFAALAKGAVLFCHVSSRVDGEPLADLLSQKGGQGFPFIAFLDPAGGVLVRCPSARDPEALGAALKTAAARLDLKKKADGGDMGARADYTIAMVEVDEATVTLDDAKKRIAGLGELTKEQRAKADAVLADIELFAIAKTVTRAPQSRLDAGRKCLDMKRGGRIPQESDASQRFWIYLIEFAEDQRDVALCEEALAALRERFGSNAAAATLIDEHAKKVAELKK